jgi:hypothetical protein
MAPADVSEALQPVAGFEGTAYAWAQGRLVWAGTSAVTDHPRNWHRPWQPPLQRLGARRLRRAGGQLLESLRSGRGPVVVCCTTSGGTPAEVGWPKVARPEPALTSSASAWPW